MGGFELLFQCVQVSGTLVTWASLSEAGRVDLEARTPLCVCGGGAVCGQSPSCTTTRLRVVFGLFQLPSAKLLSLCVV